jgi:hypothetical protein
MSKPSEIIETAAELDERDKAILVALAQHKLLTTEHIHTLFFSSLRRTQTKIQELREKGFITTLSSARARGKRPDRHHLTGLGARVAAFCLDRTPSELPAPATEAGLWRALPHRMGVNDFFCRLVAACDRHPGTGVHAWKDERQIRGGGKQVQADAFGRILHPEGAVEFLLEYDRGTEHFWPVVEKLGRYLKVSSAHSPDEPVPFPSVLFLVGGEAREAMLSRALGVAVERWDLRGARSAAMPFFVSNRRLLRAEGHLGAVWQPLTEPDRRLRLTELDGPAECWWELSECLRIRWLEGAAEQ